MEWPKDGSSLSFSDLADAVRKALRAAYSIKRKDRKRNIKWTGPPQGESCAHCCLAPADALTAESLKYNLDDQGRDALDVIIGIAIQMGIEQGRRNFKNSPEFSLMKTKLQLIKSAVED